MKFIKLLQTTPGKRHGWYETDRGSVVRKPLVRETAPYWDWKSVVAVTILITAGVLYLAFWYYMAFAYKVG